MTIHIITVATVATIARTKNVFTRRFPIESGGLD